MRSRDAWTSISTTEPLGTDKNGKPVFLREIWPSNEEIGNSRGGCRASRDVQEALRRRLHRRRALACYAGSGGRTLCMGSEERIRQSGTVLRRHAASSRRPSRTSIDARVLAVLGDSVTTDHISPAGSIAKSSPAAKYLIEHGIEQRDFNSYGARRGNHEVMMRGTFANTR